MNFAMPQQLLRR